MNSQQKIINLLTICRKANMLICGYDAVMEAVNEGKAVSVVVTGDISPKTLKNVKFFCNNAKTSIICIDINSDDIMMCMGKKFVVMAVSERGFSKKLKTLSTKIINPDQQ